MQEKEKLPAEEPGIGEAQPAGVTSPDAPAQSDKLDATGSGEGQPVGEGPTDTAPPAVEPDNGSALETLVGADQAKELAVNVLDWARANLFTFDLAIEATILIAALLPAAIFGPRLKELINTQVAPRAPTTILRRIAGAFAHIATPIALYLTLQIATIILGGLGRDTGLLSAGVSLLTAWIVIRLVTLVIRSPLWSRVAFYVVWPLAALDAFGVLDNVVAQLDAFAIPLSTNDAGQTVDISALDIVRGVITFAVLFWLANVAGNFLKGRINATDELTISFKALLAKILDILLPVVALLIALQLVSFPFGALAIFGGAIGLGVGLGLQRTVSNFAAGFTLIADKSIKPGDVIEIDDSYGWVTEMNARYVALRTRDGTDHLIPNDKFIEDGVVNWSHGDRALRIHAGFGVGYNTQDLRQVAKACEEVALTVDRVLKVPSPKCNLVNFGDSSVDFDLRFWIKDPKNGISNVKSDVMLAIWDLLHEQGIEIPFPQRDLHIRSMPDVIPEILPDS